MGQRRANREAFIAEHPTCCFCGGDTPADEMDHVPSRAFFRNRQWPEGYVFPACTACNRATRHDEQIVALLSRVYPDPSSEQEMRELNGLLRAVWRNYPAVLHELQPSARQLRNAVKKYGVAKPSGSSYADIPVLSVAGPLVNASVISFGKKLVSALFYKHSDRILAHGGGIGIRWYSNLQLDAGEIPESFAQIMPGFPELTRSARNLDDQFFYRWGLVETGDAGVFLSVFRQSFAIIGYVHHDKSAIPTSQLASIVEPNSV